MLSSAESCRTRSTKAKLESRGQRKENAIKARGRHPQCTRTSSAALLKTWLKNGYATYPAQFSKGCLARSASASNCWRFIQKMKNMTKQKIVVMRQGPNLSKESTLSS